jgi:branched-chain amino acid transport system ATP-binding protein
MALLEVRNLCVSYGAIQALHGIDLDVEAGTIVALIGANGAGKSTTLRTISGLLRPRTGEITFDGESVASRPAHRIARRGLIHVPEGRGIFANLTVSENLALSTFARTGHGDHRGDTESALSLFPRLRERLKQNAGTLSGGEQQMLAIARALLARPRLLLMDEPSLGLAPQLVQLIFRVIRDINQMGTTILLVEQNARMALTVAHTAYVVETGKIVLSGRASELIDRPDVQAAYLGH